MKRLIPKQLIHAAILFALLVQLAWSTDTLLHGQNFTAGQFLISARGIYELGFFRPGSSTNSYLGIWFSVSPDAVVWVANRNTPLNSSGILTIHNSGSLILFDLFQRMVWSSSTNSTMIANDFSPILQLNDSGNLILMDQTSNTIIWQSFDYPTNSALPGMKTGKNLVTGFERVLTSWKSSTDPSEGNYIDKMDTEGSPELVLWDRNKIRYRNGMWNGLYFSSSVPMLTYGDFFTLSFVWNKDEVSYSYDIKSISTLARVVLNDAGILQRLVWDSNEKNWNEFWSAPKDECDYYAKCGNFGICQPNSIISCGCLKGFEEVEATDWNMRDFSGGCKRRTPLECTSKGDGFYPLKEVKMPYSHNATVDANISVDECRTRCLMNCSCLAYSPSDIRGRGSGCVMWNTALVDMKYVNGGLDILYVKVSKSDLGASSRNKLAVIIGTISGIIISMLLICLVYYLLRRKKIKRSSELDKTEKSLLQKDSFDGVDHPIFDIGMILQATENFSIRNVVGEGGFSNVYKGKLPCGQEIAVKRLSKNLSQGSNEFINEVTLIAKLQHRNLVKFLGCCIGNNERMLIYEFMSNKSLDFFIFDQEKRASLCWTTKFEIIIGIARGLLYLHEDSRFNVIHRDLKAANVLLDEKMTPKISDFGTARLFERDHAVLSTEIVIGTRGYMSPEYITEGKFSIKSDVYSFGVVLLEIITGKRNQGNQSLIANVWKLWEEDDILKLLDEAIACSVMKTELSRCIHVGLLCVQEFPDDRPSMSSVFTMLSSDNLKLAAPKKPLICKNIEMFTTGSHFSESSAVTVGQLTITAIEGR